MTLLSVTGSKALPRYLDEQLELEADREGEGSWGDDSTPGPAAVHRAWWNPDAPSLAPQPETLDVYIVPATLRERGRDDADRAGILGVSRSDAGARTLIKAHASRKGEGKLSWEGNAATKRFDADAQFYCTYEISKQVLD